jgi:hypothetical protein
VHPPQGTSVEKRGRWSAGTDRWCGSKDAVRAAGPVGRGGSEAKAVVIRGGWLVVQGGDVSRSVEERTTHL